MIQGGAVDSPRRCRSGERRNYADAAGPACLGSEPRCLGGNPCALEKGIDIALQAPPELLASFDNELLVAAADNLLDNAVRYCPSRSRILVKLRQQNSLTQLCVADDGPGVPADHLERIFERHARASHA